MYPTFGRLGQSKPLFLKPFSDLKIRLNIRPAHLLKPDICIYRQINVRPSETFRRPHVYLPRICATVSDGLPLSCHLLLQLLRLILFVDNSSAHQSRKWQIILTIGTALRRTRCQIQFKTKRTLSPPSKIVIMFQIFADNSDLV